MNLSSKRLTTSSLFIIGCLCCAMAQTTLDQLQKDLPQTIGGFSLAEKPEVYSYGEESSLIATYNGDIDTYINVTFSMHDNQTFDRLLADLANAPKLFENDEMKIQAIEVAQRAGQITFEKENDRFEGNLMDETNRLLISYTGAGITQENEIKKVLTQLLSIL